MPSPLPDCMCPARGIVAVATLVLMNAGCTVDNPYYCDATTSCSAELVCDSELNRCLTARLYPRQPSFPVQGIDYVGIWSSKTDSLFAIGSQGDATRLVAGTTWYSLGQVSLPLQDLWGFDENTVWAVGQAGTVLRLRSDGRSWESEPGIPSNVDLLGIWGSSPTNRWAVGSQGSILHNEGAGWASVPSNTQHGLAAIHGRSERDFWVVGEQGIILHHDGTSFQKSAELGVNLYAVWANAADDVWVAGRNGALARWNGTEWRKVPVPVVRTIYGLWGNGANVMWAVGAGGLILRWNGSEWSQVPTTTTVDLLSVFGDGTNSVTVVGKRGTIVSYLLRRD